MPPPVNRNDPCPCGSGRKYKKCCMNRAAPAPGAARPPAPVKVPDLVQRAVAHHRRGEVAEAIAVYRAVLERKPRDETALHGLARGLAQTGRLSEGIGVLHRAVRAGERAADLVELAHLLLQRRDAAEALDCAERAARLEPLNDVAHRMVATCLERMNRVDEALAAAREANALAPEDVEAGILLARLEQRSGDGAGAAARREEIAEKTEDRPLLRSQALRELALVNDAAGEHAAAFDAAERAGIERLRTPEARRISRSAALDRIAANREGFDDELLRRGERVPARRRPPAFLIGFLRSGTTMLEQVLAAHPDIVTLDEAPLIGSVKRELARLVPEGESVPEKLARLGDGGIAALRAHYRAEAEAIAGERAGEKVLVDKTSLNTIDAGLIGVLFPGAPVLFALRDPRDVCVSCFMQPFAVNELTINFTTWTKTAEFYAAVMDLWLHQRERSPLDVLTLRYEDTVADLEAEARRMLEHLGVPFRPEVLAFHERAKERLVSTPSYAQVTEPVHARRVERWRNYERTSEITPILAPFLDAFGYA